MKIFINAGHGGVDPGAVSKNGTKEKDITRTIASYLAQLLIMAGYDVEFFQQKKSVEEVVKTEKESNSHLFISLHCNSVKSEIANGVEAFYYPNSTTGEVLARIFTDCISKSIKLNNRGIKPRKELRVLNGTNSPAVLIELAFLSNTDEEEILLKEPYRFASAIVKGMQKWNK